MDWAWVEKKEPESNGNERQEKKELKKQKLAVFIGDELKLLLCIVL